jgi:hypothetical protein
VNQGRPVMQPGALFTSGENVKHDPNRKTSPGVPMAGRGAFGIRRAIHIKARGLDVNAMRNWTQGGRPSFHGPNRP